MKYIKKLIYCIVIILLIASVAFYFYPRDISLQYDGIMYRLGDAKDSQTIKISINGYISKGLFKGDTFDGTISIGDWQLPKIHMRFDKFDRGNVFYFDESLGEYRAYGDMISRDIRKELTITVLEKDKENDGGSSWSSGNGLMISAPASNRKDALEISNRLMKDILGSGYELK